MKRRFDARLKHLTVIEMIGKNVMCGDSVILRIERGKERKVKLAMTPTNQDTTCTHSLTTRRGDGGCAESTRLVNCDDEGLVIKSSCIRYAA